MQEYYVYDYIKYIGIQFYFLCDPVSYLLLLYLHYNIILNKFKNVFCST